MIKGLKAMGKTRRNMVVFSFCFSVICLNGCGKQEKNIVEIERTPYEKLSYETTTVKQGDLEPQISLELKTEGYEKISYDATNEELKLDKVYVSVGDKVELGQLLVSFQSEIIQKQIEQYEEEYAQNQMLVEHYQKIMEIDNSQNYSADISALQSDIEVAKLYIEEAKEKLSNYQIVAKKAGTIASMSDTLQNGVFVPGENLISEVCSNGNYWTEVPQGYEFNVGETYSASDGLTSYNLKVSSINEQNVIFTPLSDMSALTESDSLTLTIELPKLTNVIYVEESAIHKVGETYYVYKQNNEGYCEATFVTVGNRVAEYRVILEGLNAGEKVTVN